jgi:hypothetical protein
MSFSAHCLSPCGFVLIELERVPLNEKQVGEPLGLRSTTEIFIAAITAGSKALM